MPAPRTAIVVGASSGIGAACVRELARRGYRIAALARRESELLEVCRLAEGARPYIHDVTRQDEVPALFKRIVADLGGLGLIVYAAGAMPRITPETWDFEKDRLVIDTNVLGCIAWMNAAAPHLAAQGSGRIVGISSIAGDRGRRGYPAYGASKAAMDSFLESVRNRVARHGVTVTTIKPGFIDTAMTQGMKGLFWLASPETAARMIVDAAERGVRVCYVLRRWALVAFVIKRIPSFIFRRMDI